MGAKKMKFKEENITNLNNIDSFFKGSLFYKE
jgi:hypothetical protein